MGIRAAASVIDCARLHRSKDTADQTDTIPAAGRRTRRIRSRATAAEFLCSACTSTGP